MDYFFIDVVDVTVSRSVDGAMLIAIALTIVAEAFVMLLMKYNRIQKTGLDSLVVNLASVGAGYVLSKLTPGLFAGYSIGSLLVLLLITLAVELPVLYLLNKKKLFAVTAKACVLMNVATYLLFYVYATLTA
ncbi:MAG: hypothetical protein ACT4OJ_02745 [Bacteroidota bacterium]